MYNCLSNHACKQLSMKCGDIWRHWGESNGVVVGNKFRPYLETVKGMRWRSAYRDADDLFLNVLSLEPECTGIEFQRFLFRNGFEIDRHFSFRSERDYKVQINGREFKGLDRSVEKRD